MECESVAEMSAGRLVVEADGRTVTADPRRGVLQLGLHEADGQVHATWSATDGGAAAAGPEPEFDAPASSWVSLSEIPGHPRTYRLKLREAVRGSSGSRAFLFWSQEADPCSDAALLSAFSTFVVAVPPPPPVPAAAVAAAAPAVVAGEPRRGATVQLDALKALMKEIAEGGGGEEDEDLLEEVLRPSSVVGTVTTEAMRERLYPHMPEETRTVEGLRELVESAQFRQAASVFEQAVKSGVVGPILQEMQVDPSAQGPAPAAMRRFLVTLVSKFSPKSSGGGGGTE